MAHVRDVRLQLGMNQEFQHLAEVTFAVEFSQAEVNQNINFGLYVTLLQYDPRVLSQYHHLSQNGAYEFGSYPQGQGNGWNPTVGRENGVLWIAREVIRPNGTKSQYFQRKATFQRQQRNSFGGQQQEFFTAHVNVIPEITEGRGWSNPFRFGNGQMPLGAQHTQQPQFFDEPQFNGAYANNLI
ncbi:MAG: hypothetical protein SFY70_08795 [Bacteroidia bacterium]|nr:hypothetical protein [Bacteroidia bacterium]